MMDLISLWNCFSKGKDALKFPERRFIDKQESADMDKLVTDISNMKVTNMTDIESKEKFDQKIISLTIFQLLLIIILTSSISIFVTINVSAIFELHLTANTSLLNITNSKNITYHTTNNVTVSSCSKNQNNSEHEIYRSCCYIVSRTSVFLWEDYGLEKAWYEKIYHVTKQMYL